MALAATHGWLPHEHAEGALASSADRELYRSDVVHTMDVVFRKGLLVTNASSEVQAYELCMFPPGNGKGYGCVRVGRYGILWFGV